MLTEWINPGREIHGLTLALVPQPSAELRDTSPGPKSAGVPKEACLQAVIPQDAFSEGTGGALESVGWGEVKVNTDCQLGSTQLFMGRSEKKCLDRVAKAS